MGELSQSGRGKKRFHIGGQQAKLSLFPVLFYQKKRKKVVERNVIREPCRRVRRRTSFDKPAKENASREEKDSLGLPGSLSSEETEREKIAPARFEISLASMSGALYDAQLVLKKPLARWLIPGTELRERRGVMTWDIPNYRFFYQPTWVVVVWERRIKFTWSWTAINFPEPFFLLACLRLSCPYMSLIVTPGYLAVAQEVRKPSCLLRIM